MTTNSKTLKWDSRTNTWVEYKKVNKPYDGRWWALTFVAITPLVLMSAYWFKLDTWQILGLWAGVGWHAEWIRQIDR